jgi:DNA-binding transcriptional LysR family regulator
MNKSSALTPARLRELQGFAAAARLLNFSRAAREMNCTPSVLSRRIAALEDAAGGRLFLRTTRRMSLTRQGEELLAQCERLESVSAEVAQALKPHAGEAAGKLYLHLPASFGRIRFAPLLARFARRHPQLRIDAVYDDAYVDLVAQRIDLAVRAGKLADSGLVARRIDTMRRLLCAAPAYLESAPGLADPLDLKQHRCIAFTSLRTGTLWQFGRERARRSVRIDPVMATNDAQAVRAAALAGVGISLQGEYIVADDLRSGKLVEVLPDWHVASSPVHLLWLPGADRAPALRRLIDFLAEKRA